MSNPTNDIDALLHELGYSASCGYKPWRHAALTALVAERNALKKRVAELEKSAFYIPPKHPPADRDRELRERDKAMERWMDQVTAMLCHSMTHSHDAKQELVTRCDAAIAAMRKGEANGE